MLTIVASNRDRLDLNSNTTKWFIKSIQWQDYTEPFELLIVDSNSQNYNDLKEYFNNNIFKVPIKIISHDIDLFSRSILNNVGIRNAKGEYVASTDVDMLFDKNFVSEVMRTVGNNIMVESRTMYWKQFLVDKIYNGELDSYDNINACKIGRIKKRTSAGGFQCMHIDSWFKVRGFDERYKVWGSEDQDLLTRAKMAGIKIRWMGESIESIKLFHQPHTKKDIKNDLAWQDKNKKMLNDIRDYGANPCGWGGYYQPLQR